jgi:hypothetical protein
MEPQDELTYNNGLTHVTLSEFLNTLYDMTGELNLEYDMDIVMEKLRSIAERSKMGGNEGIQLGLKK